MTETFWLKSKPAHRKALYRVAKELADSQNMQLRDLLQIAIGWAPDEYTGYQDNFRAGRISRKKSSQLHAWLRKTHPEFAQRLDVEVGIIKFQLPSPPPGSFRPLHKPSFNTCNCSICNPKPRGKRDAWEVLGLDEY